MTVTRMYDMQLRPEWPMGNMGNIPAMGYIVIGRDGLIRLQRVDVYFGDDTSDILMIMKRKP